MRVRSARPSIRRTFSAVTVPAPWAMAWSSMERLSRTDPSPARAMRPSASASTVTPSRAQMPERWFTSTSASTRRRSKRWQRESTVTGTLRISVVANMNFTWAGGSSSVFRKAFHAFSESMWTSSTM